MLDPYSIAILNLEEVESLLYSLFSVINKDKDNSYFICEENKDLIDRVETYFNNKLLK